MKNLIKMALIVMLTMGISGCTSSDNGSSDGASTDAGTGTGAGGGVVPGLTTSVDLNALLKSNMISSKNGSLDFIITLYGDKATVQHAVDGVINWQSLTYSYVINGENISFTRSQIQIERDYAQGLSRPGEVIPETISITFTSTLIKEGMTFTYDGIEYTVKAASSLAY